MVSLGNKNSPAETSMLCMSLHSAQFFLEISTAVVLYVSPRSIEAVGIIGG